MLLTAAVPPPTHAQEPIAAMRVSKEAIRWEPKVEVEVRQWDLRVAGPGVDLSRSFKPREAPYLRLEGKGGPLPDGGYRYELRAIPELSPEGRKMIDAARESRARGEQVDPRELPRLARELAQSGSFSIARGAFVTSEEPEPGRRTKQTGDVQVDGALKVRGEKSFVAVDPADANGQLVYVALEGPEAGTYLRGASRTIDGEAVIELPRHFAAVSEAEGLTVQLTPVGAWSRLYVAERSPCRLVVRNDGEDVAFDYLIQGVRKGYAEFQVERPASPKTNHTDSEER